MELVSTITQHLRANKLATIATAKPGSLQPESALIAFVEDGLTLYIQTGSDTRKYGNLIQNPKVALVIGFDKITLQYQGIATEVTDTSSVECIKQRFVAKDSPTNTDFLNRPGVAFFKVVPTWIGYSDYTQAKPRIAELSQF